MPIHRNTERCVRHDTRTDNPPPTQHAWITPLITPIAKCRFIFPPPAWCYGYLKLLITFHPHAVANFGLRRLGLALMPRPIRSQAQSVQHPPTPQICSGVRASHSSSLIGNFTTSLPPTPQSAHPSARCPSLDHETSSSIRA